MVVAYFCTALNTSVASIDLVDVGNCTYKADSYGRNETVQVQVTVLLCCAIAIHSCLF